MTTISLVTWVLLQSTAMTGDGKFSNLLEFGGRATASYLIDFESVKRLPVRVGDQFLAKIEASCSPARIANEAPFAHIDRRAWICTATKVEVVRVKLNTLLEK